ncbi:hypothetical protein EUBSIR_02008 [[Eubacterium] siraeum DSM 15702]|uniref:Uncharacterized protein n=1 Tax=[Eubacterium] siraeum DSM 15702 TaxID=428128 RepID=B0MQ92_9FIRM|nr:hypothetical protein EUBSIR_02008 [[Eubacterium] siraeum DSM 15702]
MYNSVHGGLLPEDGIACPDDHSQKLYGRKFPRHAFFLDYKH